MCLTPKLADAFYKISEFKKHFCVKYQALKCKTHNFLARKNVSVSFDGMKWESYEHMDGNSKDWITGTWFPF